MRAVKIERIEECVDGSRVYRCTCEGRWTRQAIQELAGLGTLEYYGDFPRPFFRLRAREGFAMAVVEGGCSCRVDCPDGRLPAGWMECVEKGPKAWRQRRDRADSVPTADALEVAL